MTEVDDPSRNPAVTAGVVTLQLGSPPFLVEIAKMMDFEATHAQYPSNTW